MTARTGTSAITNASAMVAVLTNIRRHMAFHRSLWPRSAPRPPSAQSLHD